MKFSVSLVPLTLAAHVEPLQQVYRATPGYWLMHALAGSPAGQAARDLKSAQETPGRQLMGIVHRVKTGSLENATPEQAASQESTAVEMIGALDFRLHWPQTGTVYIGMVMVARPYQRQGIATQAWSYLEPWLVESGGITTARLGVEQFNPVALQFFQSIGFDLTGESNRIRVGNKWVRLLYMEKALRGRA